MTRRVAYLECTGGLWPQVASTLLADCGWLPVYWTGSADAGPEVLEKFPDVVFQENTTAVKGRLGTWLNESDLPPVDEATLGALAYPEAMAARMMDRMDPDGSFGYHERTALFRRHLQVGLAVMRSFRPDLAVFAAAPHLIYDYTFYCLCRHLGVETVVFVETAVDGLVFTCPSFETASEVPGRVFKALTDAGAEPELSASSQAYLSKVQGNYEQAIPRYMAELFSYQPAGPSAGLATAHDRERIAELTKRYVRAKIASAPSPVKPGAKRSLVSKAGIAAQIAGRALGKRILSVLSPRDHAALQALHHLEGMLSVSRPGNMEALADALDCTSHLYQSIEQEYPLRFRSTDPPPVSYLKQFAIEPENSDLSYIEYWLYRLLALRKKREMSRRYEAVISEVDLRQPFVYVPLHYQPEVSTSPLAGFYTDQELVIEQLSKTAPEGWWIYVKEHAFQFDKKGSGELTRTLDFHQRLSLMPNVRLASTQTSPFILMDHAKAVATATGTSGWEAITRGKPVLLFGHSWYGHCEGAFDVREAGACRDALGRIAGGYQVDRRGVRRFLQALEQVGFRGYTIPDLAADSGVDPEVNAAGFVSALKSSLSSDRDDRMTPSQRLAARQNSEP